MFCIMPTMRRSTAGRDNRLHVGCRVKKVMGHWHPKYNKFLHANKYIHGTVTLSAARKKWIVWWDDGYNYNQTESVHAIHSSGLSIVHEDDDVDGVFSTVTGKNKDDKQGDTATKDGSGLVLTSPTLATETPHARFVHNLENVVTPSSAAKGPYSKYTPPPELPATQDSPPLATNLFDELVVDDDDDIMLVAKVSDNQLAYRSAVSNGDEDKCPSDSSNSRHTCDPSPETISKASKTDQPNDDDANDTWKISNIIPHCHEKSELERYKEKVREVVGEVVRVCYNKKKNLNVEWTIEEKVRNKNTHDEDTSLMPIYDYQTLDPYKVNPLKNFLEVFPQEEMIKCVNNFNTGVRHDMKLVVQNSKNAKFWRNKNTSYIKALTLSEFKIFLGLLIASTCRAETGINLWKSYRPQEHYFNSAPDFGRFMTFSRFCKIRNFFSKCFSDTSRETHDPWWEIIGGIDQFNRIRKKLFKNVPHVVLRAFYLLSKLCVESSQ